MRMEGLACMGSVCVSVTLVVCVCVSSCFSRAFLVFFLSQPPLQHEVSEVLAGVDRRTALPKVVVHTPYSSKETYFDTYFRLLHEDAHHGLRESLACCREGRPGSVGWLCPGSGRQSRRPTEPCFSCGSFPLEGTVSPAGTGCIEMWC